MKIYHRHDQLVKPQYANGRVYFIPDWRSPAFHSAEPPSGSGSQCDGDAVFLLYRGEIPFMFMRSIEVGDRIVSHYLPWEVRVVAFPMLEPGIMVVRADAYPLMWVWRVFQWQIENPLKWWLFKRLKDVGMLDCEPGLIPNWKNIRLPRFLKSDRYE